VPIGGPIVLVYGLAHESELSARSVALTCGTGNNSALYAVEAGDYSPALSRSSLRPGQAMTQAGIILGTAPI